MEGWYIGYSYILSNKQGWATPHKPLAPDQI
jgi:hypothetical protein